MGQMTMAMAYDIFEAESPPEDEPVRRWAAPETDSDDRILAGGFKRRVENRAVD